MVTCELCGQNTTTLVKVKVAGTEMNACNSCKNLGKEVERKNLGNNSHSFYKRKKDEIILEVVSNSVSLINSAMVKRNMNLQQLARISNIRESSLKNYLSGKIHIDLDTAKKIEKALEIKLTREVQESNDSHNYIISDDESSNSNLGDLLLKKLKSKNIK